MRGNLKLLGLGGMGINVVHSVYGKLPNSDEFADIDVTLLDTTEATITNYPALKGNFIKINPIKSSNKELDGLSGERRNKLVVDDIKHNVEKYVDTLDIKKNDYYVLIFSSSGGSGNIIGTMLAKELLKRDANVLVVTAIDSSNYLTAYNSMKTLESLDAMSRSIKKPLLMSIFSNNPSNGISTPETEKEVNRYIARLLTILSVFVSGSTHDLDHQDLNNLFNPGNYKTFRVDPGLYHLDVGYRSVKNRDDVLLARTLLSVNKENIELPRNILHNKSGYASNKHIELIGEDNFPMYLLYVKDKVATIHNKLSNDIQRMNPPVTTTNLATELNNDDEDLIF